MGCTLSPKDPYPEYSSGGRIRREGPSRHTVCRQEGDGEKIVAVGVFCD